MTYRFHFRAYGAAMKIPAFKNDTLVLKFIRKHTSPNNFERTNLGANHNLISRVIYKATVMKTMWDIYFAK